MKLRAHDAVEGRRLLLLLLLLSVLAASAALAQSVASLSGSSSALTFISGSRVVLSRETGPPTGAYSTYASKLTLSGISADAAATDSRSGTSPGSLPPAENRQACNNYVELCSCKYSKITQVAAHNSPFVRPGSSGSNQELPVKMQLDDGIRLVQAQVHWPANASEPHVCHTSCDLLDAGPLTAWLSQVREWVDGHPYDVFTILLGNGNYSAADLYAPFIQQSGLVRYAYEALFLPMGLADWPTLEELILPGKRVVLFLDYMADQEKYPWLLDQFANMWESPFDPQDRTFFCSIQRPPDLKPDVARDRLFLMNHNLKCLVRRLRRSAAGAGRRPAQRNQRRGWLRQPWRGYLPLPRRLGSRSQLSQRRLLQIRPSARLCLRRRRSR